MASDKSPSLNALRVFAVAAHTDSFKQAAQQLGVSQSNITRQIQVLEEQLGTRLFQRDNRVHALTPAGEALAPDLLRLFRDLERVIERTRHVGDNELTTLRIAVPESFLRWWLSSRLAEFYALYPHIQVQFTTVSLFPDSHEAAAICNQLQHEQLDFALHYGRLRDKSLTQLALYTPTYVPIALQDSDTAITDRPWLIDPNSAYWLHFRKAQPQLARHIQIRIVGNSNIAIDLLQGTEHITLMDRVFLQHPQLQQHHQFHSYQITLPESLSLSLKQRQRQPVAMVAFSKWLQTRLMHGAVDNVQPR